MSRVIVFASLCWLATAFQRNLYVAEKSELVIHAEGGELADEAAHVHDRFAWVTQPWGQCIRGPGGPLTGGVKRRTAICVSVFTGNRVAHNLCKWQDKPCAFVECSCVLEPCVDADHDLQPPCLDNETFPKRQPEFIGCIETPTLPVPVAGPGGETYDMDCMSCTGPSSCHGGLPFYRKNLSSGAGDTTCAHFCRSKGMDLSGLLPGSGNASRQCLCGATKLNTGVYHLDNVSIRKCLLLRRQSLLRNTSDRCGVRVFRYHGVYLDGAIPPERTSLMELDGAYVDATIAGHWLHDDEEQGDQAAQILAQSMAPAKREEVAGTPPWEKRDCWPSRCGYGFPWSSRSTATSGEWQDVVTIRYVYAPTVNSTRKDAWRMALQMWANEVCFEFVESGDVMDSLTFDVLVTDNFGQGCFTIGNGNQKTEDPAGYAIVALGWCNSMGQLGNMMHEVGHVLGMKHKQSRPDATGTFHDKGPYLVMNWDSIPVDDRDQWEPEPREWTGSLNEGSEDPWSGYAPYDFGSIMHYYMTAERGETVPPQAAVLTGQRSHLSEGDIKEIQDMYQCHPRVAQPGSVVTYPYPYFQLVYDTGAEQYWDAPPVCILSWDSKCVQSEKWYQGKQKCHIQTSQAMKLVVYRFSLGAGDTLFVNDVPFVGTVGPDNLVVQSGILIRWKADNWNSGKGWKLCAEPAP